MPLEITMEYEHRHGRSIPYIVETCVKHLGTFAMETEGIFRLVLLSGSHRKEIIIPLEGCLAVQMV